MTSVLYSRTYAWDEGLGQAVVDGDVSPEQPFLIMQNRVRAGYCLVRHPDR